MYTTYFSGLASITLFLGLGWYLSPLQPNIIALQLTFTPSAFLAVLDAWQPQGVARFRTHLPVDGLLLLCYAGFGYLFVAQTAWTSGLSTHGRRIASALLPLAALFDAGENLLHWHLTAISGPAEPWLYLLAGCCAALKWIFVVMFVLCMLWAPLRRRLPLR